MSIHLHLSRRRFAISRSNPRGRLISLFSVTSHLRSSNVRIMTTKYGFDRKTKVAEESAIGGDNQVKDLESRFECPICLNWLKNPTLTSCGHKFCEQCIYMWLEKEACCPVDSKPLKRDNVHLFRDNCTSREISQQRTHCVNQQFGCTVQLSPIDMDKHIEECKFKKNVQDGQEIYCTFKDLGCLESFQTEEGLQRHLKDEINTHLKIVENALPKLSTTQSQVDARALESKLWDPPPKNGVATSNEGQPTADWQQLVKNLYERIVILEQQNRELSISLSNQQTKLTTLQTSIRFNQDEMILRNCNGVYIWRLSGFGEKLSEMSTNPLRMLYSPGFYTSPNGYKFCARINVSPKDPEYLSILLHMMQTENDDALDWPFHGTMYFVLVHPSHSEKSIRERTISRPDLEAFKKPVCDLNKRSFGYTEFVRVGELNEFIQNDCLVFRIEVKADQATDDAIQYNT